VLRDLSPPSLTAAIEGNLFGMCQQFGRWPRAEVHDGPDLLWSLTDVPFPVFNSIVRAQLAPDAANAAIAAAIVRAKARKVPLLWWTGPGSAPGDLEARLVAHGFRGETIPGMAADLQALPESAPGPQGLKILRVVDADTMSIWCRTLAAGFGIPEFARDAFFEFSCAMGFAGDALYRSYLGLVDGHPVAASSIFLGAGVVGVYNVAVIPEARQQGIGAAMTASPLFGARAIGYRAAILQSSTMGAGVYRGLGFVELCRIGQYVWRDKTTE
jgi:GNAT superfamily N-acetyltransferase